MPKFWSSTVFRLMVIMRVGWRGKIKVFGETRPSPSFIINIKISTKDTKEGTKDTRARCWQDTESRLRLNALISYTVSDVKVALFVPLVPSFVSFVLQNAALVPLKINSSKFGNSGTRISKYCSQSFLIFSKYGSLSKNYSGPLNSIPFILHFSTNKGL